MAAFPGGNTTERVLIAAVGGHLLLSGLHGWAHASIPVAVPAWQALTAVVVLFLAPVAGLTLFLSGRVQRGVAVLVVAGAASLAFEGGLHYLHSGPDNVAQVTAGHGTFATTALLTTLGDLALGLVLLRAVGGYALPWLSDESPRDRT